MIRDQRRRSRRPRDVAFLAVESLETRQLLSFYTGPTASRPVISNRAISTITVSGGGFETVRQLRNGQVAITLYGTSPNSTLSILAQTGRPHFNLQPLQVAEINVRTGLLGSIQAGGADLVGAITSLGVGVSSIQFNAVGPNAKIDVPGGLNNLIVGAVDLGPTGHIHVAGLSGASSLGSVTLDGGQIAVDQDVSGALTVGNMTIQRGGMFSVGHDLSGGLQVNGTLTLNTNGQIVVGHNLDGLGVNQALNLDSGGRIHVGGDLAGFSSTTTTSTNPITTTSQMTTTQTAGSPTSTTNTTTSTQTTNPPAAAPQPAGSLVVIGPMTIDGGQLEVDQNLTGRLSTGGLKLQDGGQFLVGQDLSGGIQVLGNMSVASNGLLAVGRDFSGGLNVTGDLTLDSGGNIAVGRDLNALTVDGNLTFTPAAGALVVGGNLNGLTITGAYQGKGTSSIDLSVGLNLNNFTVLGGGAGQGSVRGANIDVAKNITNLNISHGIFNSLITAGVLISNSTVGPDGPDALFDSEIRAGSEINNLRFNGNVRSDYVTNASPSGYRTRIIAGENRQGQFTQGGLIDHFQITGQLIDAVVAASVQPNGGNGTLPTSTPYGAPTPVPSNTPGDLGFDTYDAPAGVTAAGTFNTPVAFPNYTEISYFNGLPTGVAYNRAIDPTIDDFIFPGGAINPSFATAPAATSQTATITTTTGSQSVTSTVTSTNIAQPTTSTVLGGVISTPHGDQQDFAGLFAADTGGVFVGAIPLPATGGSSLSTSVGGTTTSSGGTTSSSGGTTT